MTYEFDWKKFSKEDFAKFIQAKDLRNYEIVGYVVVKAERYKYLVDLHNHNYPFPKKCLDYTIYETNNRLVHTKWIGGIMDCFTGSDYKEFRSEAERHIKLYLNGIVKPRKEDDEIRPSRIEKTEWKTRLYERCQSLSEYYDNIAPKKKDSLNTLLEKFFYWAEEYNGGYFSEMEDVETDRYSAWLMQEWKKYRGE